MVRSAGSILVKFFRYLGIKYGHGQSFIGYFSLAGSPLFVGVWVDKWNHKNTMMFSSLIRGALSLCILGSIRLNHLPLVLFLVAISSVVSLFYNTASRAIIPSIVEKEELIHANSLFQITRIMFTLLGPVFGTVLYQAFRPQLALFLDGLSYVIAASLLYLIKRSSVLDKQEKDFSQPLLFWKSFVQGLGFAWENGAIRIIFFVFITLNVCLGVLNTLSIFLVTADSGLPESFVAWGTTIQSVGMLTAALLMGKWGKKLPSYPIMIQISTGGVAVGVLILAISANAWIMFASRYLIGMAATTLSIAATTLIQIQVPQKMLGRVGATLDTVPLTALVLSSMIGGYLFI